MKDSELNVAIIHTATPTRHPKGTSARVLLSSVFGPYARDEEHRYCKGRLMELYHNQITREQGPFSPRAFYHSYGLLLISQNIHAPCIVLDFPSKKRFIKEIKKGNYDIIGIGSVVMNVAKVEQMCNIIREHAPGTTIVVGGPIAFLPGIEHRIDADHVVRGDGVQWFRSFLGEDANAPVEQPAYPDRLSRIMGVPAPFNKSGMIITSLGCPKGCDFCFTSGAFGRKHLKFFDTGTKLFLTLCRIEMELGVSNFGILDENFLLHKREVLRLIQLMERFGKCWTFDCLTSADAVKGYSIDQLLSLGLKRIWIGLEGKDCHYAKLNNVDTRSLIKQLQANGINIIGSSIIGMDHHTPENIDEIIDWAVKQAPTFHQFMLYIALPGSQLFERMSNEGRILPETDLPVSEWHGQDRLNYRHAHIPQGSEGEMLTRAFQRDFEVNGPSIIRYIRTELAGFKKHKDHPDPRVRRRYAQKRRAMMILSPAITWATLFWYDKLVDARMVARMTSIIGEFYSEFGAITRIVPPVLGKILHATMRMESWRLSRGYTREPKTTRNKNR